jgi:hypothetical protein
VSEDHDDEQQLQEKLNPILDQLMSHDVDTYVNLRLALAPRRFFQIMCGQSAVHQQLFVECVRSDYWRYHALKNLAFNNAGKPVKSTKH